jgi:cytochrome c5
VRGDTTIRADFVFALALFAANGALLAQTMQQAELGRIAYQARCSNCHATDMGGNEAPQLAGSNFMAAWGTRTTDELVRSDAEHQLLPAGIDQHTLV